MRHSCGRTHVASDASIGNRRLSVRAWQAGAKRATCLRPAAWLGREAPATSSARKQKLLELTSGTSYGATSDSETAQQIERLVDELSGGSGSSSGKGVAAATALDGSWRLVYTTEKSVHAIVRGLPVCFVGQRVSTVSSRVTNMIDFLRSESGEGSFGLRASAPLTVTGPNRIEYRFDGFKLLLPWRRGGAAPAAGGLSAAAGGGEGIGGKGGGSSRSAVLRREQRDEARLALPLPTPRAGGWTQGVFVDSEVRVMRNSQGDTLIFVREE
ncbi:hypothetical protein CHLRE_17g713800v5 [Chlamydomonas reinhardtii]|uniref:Plastid lipid-associated protein/fibrillin conserved domain-containing protein n=1 Tax=Chlamydomonas reinhardtii TaxID=3055 RepID=A8JDD4_CHLRE|nr:uncharacterized protein CHLRE_17g713800v5 [Chlamydomonas reinhardtii]PNW70294.1 hypothetical protein CHLRE_17g713800v5 [Chlamydomonas reinhardtii]|eukprot:XP_001700406.1 predicted protein [Chlamydomonas reinhardtii]